jgi:hypothetical protein
MLAAAGLSMLASGANAQMFVNDTGNILGCTENDCPLYMLSPDMPCEHPGLCIPAPNGNFCDQPIHMVSGGAVGDFNNDGFQDLFLPQGGHVPDKLYINNGDGTFTEQAEAWGVDAFHIGSGVAVGDYDDDGWLDICMSGFGPSTGPVEGGRHLLYHNTGQNSFEEVGVAAGVSETSPDCTDAFSPAFGDYDLDGDLDLCIAGWVDFNKGTRLFMNNGDGTFTDVSDVVPNLTDPNGATLVRAFSPGFVDMNGDRWPELLLACDFGDGAPLSSRYYVNNQDGTFSDYTDLPDSGLGIDQNGMGQTFADFDGDGLLDWYVTNIWDPEGLGWPSPRIGNTLYMNDGDNTFTEIASDVGVDNGAFGWGTIAVDVDHDGDPDLVETNGYKSFGGIHANKPMFLFRNDDGATSFATIDPAISGLDDTGFGRGLIGVDFDNDGDIDVININFETEARVYRNETITKPESVPVDKSYLRVFIDTSKDPGVVAPNGYGVQVVATADNGLVQRVPIATGSNYLSQSELSAHFGLGDATLVTQLVIEWPNGTNSVRKNVAINQTITIEFCRGDWNGDAANNILDFVAYSQAWSSNDPNADLDANGQFNVLDFVAFQTLYVKCAGL